MDASQWITGQSFLNSLEVHALCLMYIVFSNNRLSLHSTSLEPEKAILSDKKNVGPIRRIHAGGAVQEGTEEGKTCAQLVEIFFLPECCHTLWIIHSTVPEDSACYLIRKDLENVTSKRTTHSSCMTVFSWWSRETCSLMRESNAAKVHLHDSIGPGGSRVILFILRNRSKECGASSLVIYLHMSKSKYYLDRWMPTSVDYIGYRLSVIG